MFYKACNFIKKRSLEQVFSCKFCEISKNTFFTEHLRTTASGKTFSFIDYTIITVIWKFVYMLYKLPADQKAKYFKIKIILDIGFTVSKAKFAYLK